MKIFIALFLIIITLFSCKKEEITDLFLSVSKESIVANGTDYTVLTVTDLTGKDVTSKVQILKNEVPYDNTSFVSETMGNFYFKAEYEGLVSNTEKINVGAVIKHTKNLLIEDYTGTWCGYCPRVSEAIKSVLKRKNVVVVIAIHDDNDMPFSQVELLKTEFEIEGFPTSMIERTYKWPYPEDEYGLTQGFSRPANCGISLESGYNETRANVKVSVEFAGAYKNSSKLVVYVTEDKLYYSQANFYPDYGANPIANFEHNHVLRLSLTHVLGDNISTDFTEIYTQNFQFELGKTKADNVSIVAFVVDKQSNETLNSRTVKLGETAAFQYIN